MAARKRKTPADSATSVETATSERRELVARAHEARDYLGRDLAAVLMGTDGCRVDAVIGRASDCLLHDLIARADAERERSRAIRATIPARADGSRWIYTPPRTFTPRGKRGPQTAEEMAAAIAAIKPHRNPKPRKVETPEQYAARMTALHRDRFAWERLPDSAEIAPDPLAEDSAAQEERSIHLQIVAAEERERTANADEVAAFDILAEIQRQTATDPACPRCLDETPGRASGTPEIPHPGPLAPELCEPCEIATRELAPVIPIRRTERALRGAGAWSLNRKRVAIPVIPVADDAERTA